MAINLPVGVKRVEVVDKIKRPTPKEKVKSLLEYQMTILEGKLKHETFLLSFETKEGIEEELEILRSLYNEGKHLFL